MDITSATTSSSTSAVQSGASFASTDFETFLKMLTTQLQNQDPLNPIDSADYAVQLATFSGVEQAVLTNDLLKAIQTQFGILGMAQLGSWVGQEARSAAPAYMDGTAVSLTPAPETGADRAVLVVRDADGDVVSREEMPVSEDAYLWLGQDAAGDALPTGPYDLTVESYLGDTLLGTEAVEHYATIIEARNGSAGTSLILRGGVEVASTAVTALRVP